MLEIALAIIPIVLMLAVGVTLKHFGILQRKDAAVVNNIIIYGTLPAYAFVVVYQANLTWLMARVPLMSISTACIIMLVSWVLGKALKLDRATTGGLMLASSFGNTGFLGYPVINAAFPAGQATAVIYDNFGMSLPLNSLGVSVAAHSGGEKPDWRQFLEFLRLPTFSFTIAALLLRGLAPGCVPAIVLKSMNYLMQATVPLAMVSLGLTLSWSALKGSPLLILLSCFLKLILFPIVMVGILHFFPLPQPLHKTMIFESCMPSAMMDGVIASKYHANGRFVSGVIVAGTLLSIITMPIIVHFAG